MTNKTSNRITLFGMKNLILESDLRGLENKGIELGHSKKISEEEKTNKEFFEKEILKKAEKMAQFYVSYYCIENTIRKLIKDTLEEMYGLDWWEQKVPIDVKETVEKKVKEGKDTTITRIEDHFLIYTSFGDLIKIFENNWDDFKNIFRSQKSMKETLLQLNKLRNVVAHSCELNDLDIQRFNLYVSDWFLRVLK